MGAAKRRGTPEQRAAQAQERTQAEMAARHAADVELQKARQAATVEAMIPFLIRGIKHRQHAAWINRLNLRPKAGA